MADYYPLIARAVAGLEKNTGDARRALYERARTALVTQLRSVVPALSESDITRERLGLEEAIRKVEAEAARRSRLDPKPDAAVRPEPRPPSRPEPAAPELESRPERRPSPPPAASERRREARPPERPSLSDQGLKGFRDVVAEADDLGGAAARAARSARETFAQVPTPSGEPERLEPRIDAAPDAARPEPPRSDLPRPPRRERLRERAAVSRPATRDPLLSREALRERPRREAEPPPEPPRDPFPAPLYEQTEPDMLEPAMEMADTRPMPPRSRQFDEDDETQARPRRSYRGPILVALAVMLLAAIATGGWMLRGQFISLYQVIFASKPTPPTKPVVRDNNNAAPQAKITDRIAPGSPGTVTPTPGTAPDQQQVAPVAQRAVLYEEDPNDPQGKRFVGSVVWRTETASQSPGMSPDIVVRGNVEVPDRHLNLTVTVRRNTDSALPASHTVEIMFNLPADFAGGGISNVPGVLMKQAEQTRGVPLSGLAVKVTTGFFLIGLSAVEADVARNTQLLKERAWFDIPVVYTNGTRAILALEKGTPGDRAFEEAFKVWATRK